MQATVRVHAMIFGRVQGVFFRATTQQQAAGLQLAGWVRNRRDGTVELVAEGPAEQVDALIAWCHDGPPMARVDRVEHTRTEPIGLTGGFDVRPSL